MATITPVEDQGNLSEPLVTGEPVVTSGRVSWATKDPESDTMPLPEGVWRYLLHGCFINCFCSPVFWLGWCCNPILILLAQTMTGFRLEPSGPFGEDYTKTFKTVSIVLLLVLARIYIAFEAYSFSGVLAQTMTRMHVDPCGSSDADGGYKKIFKTVFILFFLVVLAINIASDAQSIFVLLVHTMTRIKTSKTVFVVFLLVLTKINLFFQRYSFSVLLAHMMTRMHLDPCGSSGGHYKKTFKTVFVILFIFAINYAFEAYWLSVLKNHTNDLSTAFWVLYYIEAPIAIVFALHILVIGILTRSASRQKSNIPVGKCKDVEHFCCMFWCACCSTEELARHTADYETYDAESCEVEEQYSDMCHKGGSIK